MPYQPLLMAKLTFVYEDGKKEWHPFPLDALPHTHQIRVMAQQVSVVIITTGMPMKGGRRLRSIEITALRPEPCPYVEIPGGSDQDGEPAVIQRRCLDLKEHAGRHSMSP